MVKLLGSACLLAFLVGCSSVPDVQYNYYFAKSHTVLNIAQTVTCDPSRANLIVVTTASAPTTVYSADRAGGQQRINIRDIEGDFHTFVDSDATFQFYDDGRLKSINQNTVGQGEAVIKSAVSLATTAFPLGAHGFATLAECSKIDIWAGGDGKGPPKSVNLSYSTEFDIPHVLGKSFAINPTPATKELYDQLKKKLPPISVSIGAAWAVGGRASYLLPAGYSEDDVVGLRLQKTANVEIKVLSNQKPIWKGNVVVPLPDTYALPIPRAALFGKQNFSLTLSEAGAIQSVDYGKLSGAAGALNAAQSVANAPSQAMANQVADVKAQADLIAQTQRLLRCQTHPTTCN